MTDQSKLLGDATAQETISPLPDVQQTLPTAMTICDQAGVLRAEVRDTHARAEVLHQRTLLDQWIGRSTERGRESPEPLLAHLSDLGFAWRDIARMVGVSVPALRSWRRGEKTPTGENRRKIAGLVAVCDLATEQYLINEVASWFEMPIHEDAPVNVIDLWAEGRKDLVLDYASHHVTDPEEILSSYDRNWRERFRSDHEVFEAADGHLSIRPKGH